MFKGILQDVVIAFAVFGLLTTIGKGWSVFQDYGKVFVVTRTETYTAGMRTFGSLYDNRALVIMKEERGYEVRRAVDMELKDSLYPGDRISFDLLGIPHRL